MMKKQNAYIQRERIHNSNFVLDMHAYSIDAEENEIAMNSASSKRIKLY